LAAYVKHLISKQRNSGVKFSTTRADIMEKQHPFRIRQIAIVKKKFQLREVVTTAYAAILLLGFLKWVLCSRFHPQRSGHWVPLYFSAYGGKIQATRCAGGR
jgi:xanthine dehydrogenase molybdopterin-binding subunit B